MLFHTPLEDSPAVKFKSNLLVPPVALEYVAHGLEKFNPFAKINSGVADSPCPTVEAEPELVNFTILNPASIFFFTVEAIREPLALILSEVGAYQFQDA